ncbi:MAG: hypothetical protein ABIJ12_07160 [bacterium]
MFLDYRKFFDFLNEHYSSEESIKARLVGTKRDYDSGYFDIVRYFGSDAIDPQDVKIKYLPDQYELKDQQIAKFAREIENKLREQGRMYDGPFVTRAILDGFYERIILQKCRYGTFAGSCFALDEENDIFGEYRTLRNYYINQKYSGLEDHPLALCLGICGVLIFRDQNKKKCLLMERSGNLASLENSIGPSAAGSVDYSEKYKTLDELIIDALGSEIQEELNLTSEEYKITPLAYAREIFRGEKPQIFCMIESSLTIDEISKRLDSIKKPEEFTSYQFVDLNDIISQKIKPNHEALMNCFLIEEYLNMTNKTGSAC